MAVRVDREGRLMRDYHTAQNVRRADPTKGTQDTVLSERFYLADADFLVGLEGDRAIPGTARRRAPPARLAAVPRPQGVRARRCRCRDGISDGKLLEVHVEARPWRKRHRGEKPARQAASRRGRSGLRRRASHGRTCRCRLSAATAGSASGT